MKNSSNSEGIRQGKFTKPGDETPARADKANPENWG